MQSLRRLINTFVVMFLDNVLPNRMKRLILLSSLYAKINSVSEPDKAIALKLNQVLSLSKSHEALLFPMQLGNRLWRDSIKVECGNSKSLKINSFSEIAIASLTRTEMRIVSDQILKTIPQWLKYGSNRQMKQDLTILLSSYQTG